MRILHFYKTCQTESTGGVEQFIHQLGSGVVNQGAHVDVLCLSKSPKTIESAGMTIYQAKLNFELCSTGFSYSVFHLFSKLAQKADIIHCHFPWPFMDVVHFVNNIQKPTIVTYHSDIIRQKTLALFYRPLMNTFFNKVNRLVTTSPNYMASSKVLKNFAHKTIAIPIGLDRNMYPTPTEERLQYWRKQVGEKFFLFIGVLRYYKGLHILLEAAKQVNYPIVVAGAGPIEQDLRAQAQLLGLSNVSFVRVLSDEDKNALLTLCYAFVFPSHLRSEAFGISLLEAAMFGKPMISAEIGTGTTFVNIDGETGLSVPPNDSAALFKAMQYLWEHPDVAQAMGVAAQKRYQEVFTAERMVKSYMHLYEDLVEKAPLVA